MKVTFAAITTVILLAACSGGSENPVPEAPATATTEADAPASPEAVPPNALTGPSAGLWRSTTTTAGMALEPTETCYDRQMTMEDMQAVQEAAGVICSENTYNTTPNGIAGHSVCKMGGMTITSDTRIAGDFNTGYTTEIISTMDPAPPGVPNPSTTTVKMERLGDCPPA